MTDGAARLSGIAWGHFRRWFVRGRVFRLAVQVRSLTLATLGVLLTIFGWWLIAQPFRASDEGKLRTAHYVTCPWKSDAQASPLEIFTRGTRGPDMGSPPSDPVVDPWRRLSTPAFEFLEYTQTFVGAAFLSL